MKIKRLLLLLLVTLSALVPAAAAEPLAIRELFDSNTVSDPGVTAVEMSGDQPYLRRYALTRLMLFKGEAAKYEKTVARLVMADGKSTTNRDVRYRDGRLYYAYFTLPVAAKGSRRLHRYIYYFYNDKTTPATVMVICLEGTLSASKAKLLFDQYKNKD